MQKSISVGYFLFLGAIIGIEFAAGALIAPVIFYPSAFIGEGVLTHFQSGVLMTQIFLKLNIILFVWVIVAWAYEVYMLVSKRKDILSFLILLFISACVLMFVFYFTPYMVQAQQQGEQAILTNDFKTIHQASEIDMKVLMMLQITLFFRRLWLMFKQV